MDEAKRKETIQTYVNELNAHCSANSNLTQTSIQNATEISTPSVLLSLPADSVKAGLGPDAVNTMYQNVLAWEEVLFVANKTQGIIDTDVNIASYKYPLYAYVRGRVHVCCGQPYWYRLWLCFRACMRQTDFRRKCFSVRMGHCP